MIRIGFDAKRLFHNFTGLGNYSRTLVANLTALYPQHEYFLYTPTAPLHPRNQSFHDPAAYSLKTATGSFPPLWRMRGMLTDLQRDKVQLYHGLSHEIPLGIQKTGIRTVVTMHDLLFKRFPRQYSAIDRNIYNGKFRYACHYADHIIAISEATKADLIRYYLVPPEKIDVIYQSCHESFQQVCAADIIQQTRERYNLPPDYLLYVGSIIERKNLLSIIKAMQSLRPSFQLPLVVVGQGGRYRAKVESYLMTHQMQGQVHFIQPVFDDFPALYQGAAIFLYPSLGEGFGIPIIEALYSRTPVITSKRSSLPEAAGPNSYLIDPTEPRQIAIAIEGILGDSNFREKMITAGYQYVQRFQPEPLTHQIMALYERILDQSKN